MDEAESNTLEEISSLLKKTKDGIAGIGVQLKTIQNKYVIMVNLLSNIKDEKDTKQGMAGRISSPFV